MELSGGLDISNNVQLSLFYLDVKIHIILLSWRILGDVIIAEIEIFTSNLSGIICLGYKYVKSLGIQIWLSSY